jgi:hypothetical protein
VTVAALYVDPRGPYPKLLGPELCWDESRDARLYDGPHPVVAHPPCGPYGRRRHSYRGTEHDCAPQAIRQVREFGGVLEHPADSKLWELYDLPRPGMAGDEYGFSIVVQQVEWGHVARKSTWLYIVGVSWLRVCSLVAARPFQGRAPTHWLSGDRNCKTGGSVPPGIKVCSAQQRRRTPVTFAEFLIALAEQARPAAARVA